MPSIHTFEVVSVALETANIKQFQLKPIDTFVPDWTAGAHVRVAIGSEGNSASTNAGDRAYSLMRLPDLVEGRIALGVLRENHSTGGSVFMHRLQCGDKIVLSEPINNFELGEHIHTILIAGGIGITPIFSMCAELALAGRSYAAHYAGRSESTLAFVPQLREICGENLQLHYDDQENALDISSILQAAMPETHVYCCGPAGMIEAVKTQASDLGWADDRIHYELFTADIDDTQNTAFDVEISSTGQIIHVAAQTTIIAALEAAGLDPLYDCQRGDCGICQCAVIEGIPDHRDVILTDEEKASNKVMQICVSRAKSAKLILDI